MNWAFERDPADANDYGMEEHNNPCPNIYDVIADAMTDKRQMSALQLLEAITQFIMHRDVPAMDENGGRPRILADLQKAMENHGWKHDDLDALREHEHEMSTRGADHCGCTECDLQSMDDDRTCIDKEEIN